MHMRKGSPTSVSVTSSKCVVKDFKKEFRIVFPDLLFHHLEKPVLVGLDKLEVAAGVVDSYLISPIGNVSMFDQPCLLFFFFP